MYIIIKSSYQTLTLQTSHRHGKTCITMLYTSFILSFCNKQQKRIMNPVSIAQFQKLSIDFVIFTLTNMHLVLHLYFQHLSSDFFTCRKKIMSQNVLPACTNFHILQSWYLCFFLTSTIVSLLPTFFRISFHSFFIHFLCLFQKTVLRLTDVFPFLNMFTTLVLAWNLAFYLKWKFVIIAVFH